MPTPPPVPSQLLDESADFIRHGWLPEIAGLDVRGDSPPEDLFVFALRTLLLRELLEGRMHLVRNAALLDTAVAGANYEVDVLLTQPLRGAQLVIECQSYRYHGKALTPAQHRYETERVRALGRMRVRFLPFTGAEMLQPWRAALEVIDCINGAFPEFAAIHLPDAVVSRAQRYAAGPAFSWSPAADPGEKPAATGGTGAARLPVNERLDRGVPDEIIARARQISGRTEETVDPPSRVFVAWSSAEEAVLREAYAYSQDTEVLAALLARPGGAIAHRLARLGLLEHQRNAARVAGLVRRPA